MSNTREEERRRRLVELHKRLQMNDGKSSLTAIFGWGGLRWGSRRERVREYLRVFEDAGLIEVFDKEDRIAWLGK